MEKHSTWTLRPMFILSMGVLRELVAIPIVPANFTAGLRCQTVWYMMKFMSRLWLSWVGEEGKGLEHHRTFQFLEAPQSQEQGGW